VNAPARFVAADYSGCRGSSLALLSSGVGWGATFC